MKPTAQLQRGISNTVMHWSMAALAYQKHSSTAHRFVFAGRVLSSRELELQCRQRVGHSGASSSNRHAHTERALHPSAKLLGLCQGWTLLLPTLRKLPSFPASLSFGPGNPTSIPGTNRASKTVILTYLKGSSEK